MKTFSFFIGILFIITQCSIAKRLRQNVLTTSPRSHIKQVHEVKEHYAIPVLHKMKQDMMDVKLAKKKVNVIKKFKRHGKHLDKGSEVISNFIKKSDEKQRYHLDPLLNIMRRRAHEMTSEDDTSSSMELKNWKDEWKEHWLQKKLEAINSSRPKGDIVNMAAARPWGKPCGDPNQHDMPWGTCMLPMECDAEFRIFRGDYFCGRTQFVCCALQVTTYDLYQGFDVSFADSSLETDTEEKKKRNTGSKERKRRKKYRDQQKRRRDRAKRKRKMRRNIKKIVSQIKKILNRHYRNGTTQKSRKTRQLRKFVKMLKKKFKEERKVIKDLHEMNIIKADAEMQGRMNQIKALNEEFMKNDTFREIIVNGTIKNDAALRLLANYPDLASMFNSRRNVKRPSDHLDYDIEYGYLYY